MFVPASGREAVFRTLERQDTLIGGLWSDMEQTRDLMELYQREHQSLHQTIDDFSACVRVLREDLDFLINMTVLPIHQGSYITIPDSPPPSPVQYYPTSLHFTNRGVFPAARP